MCSWRTYLQMLLDTRNNDTYGLRVGISMVFKILGTSCLRGQNQSIWSWPTYHHMFIYAKNKNTWMFGVGVEITSVFEILGHFLFKEGHEHPTLSWPSYHLMLLDKGNKNIYSLGVENSTVFKIWKNPLLCPHLTPGDDAFNKLAFALCLKVLM
jgi:hypothetical protein